MEVQRCSNGPPPSHLYSCSTQFLYTFPMYFPSPVFVIFSLISSFPHLLPHSANLPFFWPRDPSKAHHFHPALSVAAQDEESDMIKIPENTPNIQEITMHYSAQKQGKIRCLQDPQHTYTSKRFTKPFTCLLKLSSICAGVSLHTSSYLRPASLCSLSKRGTR